MEDRRDVKGEIGGKDASVGRSSGDEDWRSEGGGSCRMRRNPLSKLLGSRTGERLGA